ncbi:hypothetical protein COO60DRAFT_546642 [Scenedesmus sp. NREL 46B-D3]|nr:hypothetical protein COO60DRAFT_546642 [Scenedesmus sp. NREL 46B-D3]
MKSTRLSVVALLLGAQLLLCAHTCRGDRNRPKDDEDVQMFELSGPVRPHDFPAKRLTAPESGWQFAGYDAVQNTPVVETSRGVLEVMINHKPIKGVTPKMVLWMYSNLDKVVQLPPRLAQQYNAKRAAMFMLLHPVDHISVALANQPRGPIVRGTNLNWMEMPASQCSYTGEAVNMWSCPAGRTGYTPLTSTSEYDARFYTKTSNTVVQSDINGFKTLKTVESQLGPLTTSYSGHSWSFEKGLLRPSSVYRIGLVEQANDGEYQLDTSRRFLSIINGRIATAFVNGAPFDVRAQGYALLLHSIQEWQRLPDWLPAVYKHVKRGGSRSML